MTAPIPGPVTPLLAVPMRLLAMALCTALTMVSIILSFGNAWWVIGAFLGAGGVLEAARHHDRVRW